MKTFAATNLPSEPQTWPRWRKTALTRAVKINGPFVVKTDEGPLVCEDGWLALDSRGLPYPIASEEFATIYEPVAED